jgi:hypothetical protein
VIGTGAATVLTPSALAIALVIPTHALVTEGGSIVSKLLAQGRVLALEVEERDGALVVVSRGSGLGVRSR